MFILIFGIILSIFSMLFVTVCNALLYRKAGYKGWEAIVPFYNTWCMLKLIGLPAWHSVIIFLSPFLFFIPVAGGLFGVAYMFYMLCLSWMFYKTYGVSMPMFILSIFFSIIVLPIIAFSNKYDYQGPLYEAKETKLDVVIFCVPVITGGIAGVATMVPLLVGLLQQIYLWFMW